MPSGSFPRRRSIVRNISAVVKVLDAISEWCGKIFSWFIVTVIALSLYEVFTRRLLGKPTIWTHEIIAYCFAGAILLTLGYTLKHKAHANVDILYDYLPPRAQAILDLVAYTFFLGTFVAFLLYFGIKFAATSWSIGVFLLALQMISDVIKRIVFLVKGERL